MICGWMGWDGVVCGKACRWFGSRTWVVQGFSSDTRTGSDFKPGSKNRTRLGFHLGLMRIRNQPVILTGQVK
jgi:hypothetical protein